MSAGSITILFFFYVFTAIPISGRLAVIGASTKKHWTGYGYEKCFERGFIIHSSLLFLAMCVWTLINHP